ncbi:SMI1/KNR4 family protein [Streptomyces smaragdinus]|uniref:SMI1/KNR4 family protein n=1 Tax=Streptomyces smaragdinus TaxID=2585196 RepID=UPI0018867BB0|nr:SMI1/KNR4 family protein [Streptomyces smaragdinus]
MIATVRAKAMRQVRSRRAVSYPIFEPVLTGSEIAEVEAQYGVGLPEDYRTFLAEVGAGGPGPDIELTSLCRVDGKWAWVWDDVPVRPDVSGPFVETEDWPDKQIATLRAAGHEPTRRDEDEDYLHDYVTAFGPQGEHIWFTERERGAVQISDNGCGMTD